MAEKEFGRVGRQAEKVLGRGWVVKAVGGAESSRQEAWASCPPPTASTHLHLTLTTQHKKAMVSKTESRIVECNTLLEE